MFNKTLLAGAMALSFSGVALAEEKTPSLQEMWKLIQSQQKEIETLKRKNQQLSDQVEVTSEIAEKAASTETTSTGHGHGGKGKTSIGGYGELHYNNLDSGSEMDFHRFVLFFGHEFNERTRLFTELEVEHALAGDGKPGEVELEQAYVEFDINDKHSAKAGVFLIPVGILNETHEPETFYGVERNPVEKNIIPTTWWEGGAGLAGQFGQGFSYDVAVHSGLKTSAANNYAIRGGRQKVANAEAEDLAVTGRVKYTGIPGLELAATVNHQTDITQSNDATAGSATLFETHAVYQNGPFGVRALYAMWDLDGAGPASVGADEQKGWYIEPSYKLRSDFGIFARYSEWDNQAGDSTDSVKEQTNIGFNYWPHEQVVIKFDVQDQSGAANDDGFNLGVGYSF